MRLLILFLLLLLKTVAFGQDSVTVAAGTNDLHRYTLFLKGEFHDRRVENERSFLLLAKYLYSHNNVRYLVFEYGPDFSYLANRYLQTQVDLLPQKNYLGFSKSFWDSLVLFNRDKPASDRLKIAGFDFNRNIFTAIAFSEMMLNKAPFPEPAIQALLAKITEWKNIPWTWEGQDEFIQQLKALRSLCEKQEPALKAYFGEDWTTFSTILNHDVQSKSTVDRDKKGVEYVKAFLNAKGEGNVLFNYGISHTFLNGIGMGKLLNNDPRFSGKVCSIYPYYRQQPNEVSVSQKKDYYLPDDFPAQTQAVPDYSLINMEQRGFYPKEFKISQWVYLILKAKQP